MSSRGAWAEEDLRAYWSSGGDAARLAVVADMLGSGGGGRMRVCVCVGGTVILFDIMVICRVLVIWHSTKSVIFFVFFPLFLFHNVFFEL